MTEFSKDTIEWLARSGWTEDAVVDTRNYEETLKDAAFTVHNAAVFMEKIRRTSSSLSSCQGRKYERRNALRSVDHRETYPAFCNEGLWRDCRKGVVPMEMMNRFRPSFESWPLCFLKAVRNCS